MKRVFLSGVAGTGMSALAGLFVEKGFEVYGSDRAFYPPVGDILKKMDIQLFEGYRESNIPKNSDICVVGNIISRGNPEAEAILNRGVEYCSMAEALYRFFIKGRSSIVAAGTHGKTTISSFIAFMLKEAGLSPGYFIGGKPLDLETGYSCGDGDYFVSEGDEYETSFFDRSSKFLKYHPEYLILTAMEYDHLDFFPTEELYLKSFTNLVNQVPSEGLIISNGDYPMNRKAVEKSFTPVLTYGAQKDCLCKIKDIISDENGYKFTLNYKGSNYSFSTPLMGRYNIWNLTAGILLGLNLDIEYESLVKSVSGFRGVERRMNLLGVKGDTIFLEDFAHHPTSVKSVVQSLRERFPSRRITVMFEPGSHSLKSNYFFEPLAGAFEGADEVLFYYPPNGKGKLKDPLDIDSLRENIEKGGVKTSSMDNIEDLEIYINRLDFSVNNLIVLISNGSLGGLPGFVKSFASK